MFPPAVIPRRNNTKADTKRNDPEKSTRDSEGLELPVILEVRDSIVLNWKQIMASEMAVNGTCAKKAALQFQVSLTYPPNTPPMPLPRPQKTLLRPCQSARCRKGIKSLTIIVDMELRQPPPTPANTLPNIIVHSSLAKPQTRFPMAKRRLLTIKPHCREKMSVSLPLNGCVAACPIKNPVASHAKRERELKLVAIGAARVAMTVPSVMLSAYKSMNLNVTRIGRSESTHLDQR